MRTKLWGLYIRCIYIYICVCVHMYVHMHLNVYTHRESKYSSTSWPKDIDPFDSSDTSSGAPLLQILISASIYI